MSARLERPRASATLPLALLAIALQPGTALAQQAAQQTAQPPGRAASSTLPGVVVLGNATQATKPPKQGDAEDAYRVDAVNSLGPLGRAKLLDTPNSIEILPQALLENAQATSIKEALKYVPLVQFQEQQGSEILRPATRGMQSSNFQNARMDGMTVFVTGANAIEQLQQIEIFSGPASAAYGPANPAGMSNFVLKRPTAEPLRRFNLGYATKSILTAHADLGGPLGTSDVVGYRLNVLESKGTAFVSRSELERNLGSLAIDIRPSRETTMEFNASVYDLKEKGYPGWFTYGQSIQLPDAPDPTKAGLGQSYAGVAMQNKIASTRLKQDLGSNWHLVAGGLVQQIDRNINTPVNNLTDNAGNYTSSLANGFAPRFVITSNTVYLNGSVKSGQIGHIPFISEFRNWRVLDRLVII